MKYVFVLGAARSGTTWLGDLLSLTTSSIKYVDEPFPKCRKDLLAPIQDKRFSRPWFLPFNANNNNIKHLQQSLRELINSNNIFQKRYLHHVVKKEDNDYNVLLVKDVHNLGIYPHLLKEFPDCKIVVITRDTKRVLDSYFNTFGFQKPYLMSEYKYIKSCIRKKQGTGNVYVDQVLAELPESLIKQIKKIKLCKRNEILERAFAIDIMKRQLQKWAQDDQRIMHITHERLCKTPIEVMQGVYEHCELSFDHITEKKILEKSTGQQQGKFHTSKDSIQILNQEYRVLTNKMLKQLDNVELS